MSIDDVIEEILLDAGDLFEQNQDNVFEKILQARNIFFLDTCFVSKSNHLPTIEYLFEALEKMAGGIKEKELVIVVTEVVLYEMKDSASNILQSKMKDFFVRLSDRGFCVVLLKEQGVFLGVNRFSSLGIEECNKVFVKHLNINKPTLMNTTKAICEDETFMEKAILSNSYIVPKGVEFVQEVITHIKRKKIGKDSLAEELVIICVLAFLVIFRNSKRNRIFFCSDDFTAIARFNKAVESTFPESQSSIGTINLFSMVQYMIGEGIIRDESLAIDSLKKMMGEKVKIIIANELPIMSEAKTMSIEEAVKAIFSGEKVYYTGKAC